MRKMHWQLMLAAVLLMAFGALFLLHALLFRDVKNLAYYLLLDFAFIPCRFSSFH